MKQDHMQRICLWSKICLTFVMHSKKNLFKNKNIYLQTICLQFVCVYIYIYIYVSVCVCVCEDLVLNNPQGLICN